MFIPYWLVILCIKAEEFNDFVQINAPVLPVAGIGQCSVEQVTFFFK